MNCHIIVGATNTGKPSLVKRLLKKANKKAFFIYDVNNEYKEFFNYPLMDINTFIYKANFINRGIIIIEEATIFFSNRGSNNLLKELLVRKRHTKNHIILIFHSVRSIPRYVYELANYITIFKTNDSPEMSAKELKDERIEKIMSIVKQSKNQHFSQTLKIY